MLPVFECFKCEERKPHKLSWYETSEGIHLLQAECATCGKFNGIVAPSPSLIPLMPEHPIVESLGLKRVDGSDWKHMPFLAFDTETTGLGPDAQIVDLGYLHCILGTENDLESRLIMPRPQPDWANANVMSAMAVNNISQKDLENCPAFSDVFDKFLYACRYPIWCGHNVFFDLRMIKQERVRIESELKVDYTLSISRPVFIADTLLLDLALRPNYGKRKLSVVAERWGVQPDGEHRALADAKTASRIFCRMMTELPGPLIEVEQLQREARVRWDEIGENARRKKEQGQA